MSNFPFPAAIDIPGPVPDNVPDVCPTSALGSCGQLVAKEDLVETVASGSQTVGTTVLLPKLLPLSLLDIIFIAIAVTLLCYCLYHSFLLRLLCLFVLCYLIILNRF